MKAFLARLRAALRKIRQRNILGSASRSWQSSAFRLSSWAVVVSMMWLTWTPGLMNISAEGGPERNHYGP